MLCDDDDEAFDNPPLVVSSSKICLFPKGFLATGKLSTQMLTINRPELAWLGTETNQFGTDEFLKWCEVLGTEPYFCLNFGTGTLDEGRLSSKPPLLKPCKTNQRSIALAWVEYCNGTGNTYYANLRRKNGRQEPYNVCAFFMLKKSLG